MGRIVVSEFVTLDGVMEDPGGAEGFPRGGWAFKFNRGPKGDQFKLDELMAAESLLLGRVTYQGFASAWPSRTGEFADKMNGMQKFVVSATLQDPAWKNTKVISANVIPELSKLRSESRGDCLVAGSGRLVQALVRSNLVDEYRLMVFPIVLGAGKRLFNSTDASASLELVESTPVDSGIMILVYHPGKQ